MLLKIFGYLALLGGPAVLSTIMLVDAFSPPAPHHLTLPKGSIAPAYKNPRKCLTPESLVYCWEEKPEIVIQ